VACVVQKYRNAKNDHRHDQWDHQGAGVGRSVVQVLDQIGNDHHHHNVRAEGQPLEQNIEDDVFLAVAHHTDEPFVDHKNSTFQTFSVSLSYLYS